MVVYRADSCQCGNLCSSIKAAPPDSTYDLVRMQLQRLVQPAQRWPFAGIASGLRGAGIVPESFGDMDLNHLLCVALFSFDSCCLRIFSGRRLQDCRSLPPPLLSAWQQSAEYKPHYLILSMQFSHVDLCVCTSLRTA